MIFTREAAAANQGFFKEADTSGCSEKCIQRGAKPGVGACQILEYFKDRRHKQFDTPKNGCLAAGQMANDPFMGSY